MRLAYVCADWGVPIFGRKGCSIHVEEVVRAAVAAGCDVHLLCARKERVRPAHFPDVTIDVLPLPAADDLASRERAAMAANGALQAALRRGGPFDAVYERQSLWSWAGMEHARAAGIPGILEINAPLIDEQRTYRDLVDVAGAEAVAERALAAASHVVVVSRVLRDLVAQRYPSVRDRIHVVPNGVRAERFREPGSASRPAPPGAFTVGFVGTLKPWHGLPVLVDAFAILHERCPAARLLVVGDGAERRTLEGDLAARDLSHVTELVGAVEPGEVPGLLASMDAAVAPYADHPAFYFSPLKVYEYMAAGLPVVASRIGQLADVVEHGVSGLLCRPGDAGELAAALEGLARDETLRARLGNAARQRVLREFTWDRSVARCFALAGLRPRGAGSGLAFAYGDNRSGHSRGGYLAVRESKT